ncbi:hypothetical protein LOK49_LG10G00615 [Camellia lanceoleosa]|uniref:Uncharacterized protein n=1 Tax=Camellia lanceoleosa TaxID=1840588 RepID=A0ACC0G822_9ERIC|nr:hypothetical protein LOK49_LG10G00615 [Camellia lanceoleosa]
MRAAATVAGITVMNGDLHGILSVSPPKHQVTSATHRASRLISSIVASSEEVNRNILTTSQSNLIDAMSQKLDMPRILLKERGAFGNANTGGIWLSSARAVRCWVKSRNERNPRV